MQRRCLYGTSGDYSGRRRQLLVHSVCLSSSGVEADGSTSALTYAFTLATIVCALAYDGNSNLGRSYQNVKRLPTWCSPCTRRGLSRVPCHRRASTLISSVPFDLVVGCVTWIEEVDGRVYLTVVDSGVVSLFSRSRWYTSSSRKGQERETNIEEQ